MSSVIASSPPLPQHELQQHYYYPSPNTATIEASPSMSAGGPASIASDNNSTISAFATTIQPPYISSINPRPDYVAQAVASQVATALFHAQKEIQSDGDETHTDEPDRVDVSVGATTHINGFLDKTLHDFLAAAQSTSLSSLRYAVAEVLRKNLGKDAVSHADANLDDLLADHEEELDPERPSTRDSRARFDLEYTWKRVRLRVMMRSDKSDFDVDDDEKYVQQESLIPPSRRVSDSAAVISLQSEIFLAGVLDFISDQLMNLAIIPAGNRSRRESKKSIPKNAHILYIEESDLEKGALNSPLDRLWRTWRKALRMRMSSLTSSPRHGITFYDDSSPALTHKERGSWGSGPYHGAQMMSRGNTIGDDNPHHYHGRESVPDFHDYPEHIIASNIPLPMGARDVDEIEVPGLARDPDDTLEAPRHELRPHSFRSTSKLNTRYEMGQPALRRPGRDRSTSAPVPLAHQLFFRRLSAYTPHPSRPTSFIKKLQSKRSSHVKLNPPLSFSGFNSKHNSPPSSRDELAKVEETFVKTNSLKDVEQVRNEAQDDTFLDSYEEMGEATLPFQSVVMPQVKEEQSPNGKKHCEAAVGIGLASDHYMPNTQHSSDKVDSAMPAEQGYDENMKDDLVSPRSAVKLLQTFPRTVSDTSESPSRYTSSPIRSRVDTSPRNESSLWHNRVGTGSSIYSYGEPYSSSSPKVASDSMSGEKMMEISQSVSPERQILRKPMTVAPRLTDDLARARGSPTLRQSPISDRDFAVDNVSPVSRKENPRRSALDRHASLVSLIDDNTNKLRTKTSMFGSSTASAEDFDNLISGRETIKMTLSPQSIRENPSVPPSRSGSDDQSALSGLGGLRENITNVLRKKTDNDDGSTRSPSIGSPVLGNRGRSDNEMTGRPDSRPSPNEKIKGRSRGYTARDATLQTDSTRDFADFIRSTGPDRKTQTLPPAPVPTLANTTKASTQSTQRSTSINSLGALGPLNQSPVLPQISSNSGIKYKQSYAPREARGTDNASNYGLIDFIRNGPNPGKDNRPGKEIAPFRYSMDDDDLRPAVETINLDAHPGGLATEIDGHRSSISTMATMQTVNTYNSHAPLVPAKNRTSPILSSSNNDRIQKSVQKKAMESAESDGVTRYRNKDPYALDVSDDDDDDDIFGGATTSTKPKQSNSRIKPKTSLGEFMTDSNIASAIRTGYEPVKKVPIRSVSPNITASPSTTVAAASPLIGSTASSPKPGSNGLGIDRKAVSVPVKIPRLGPKLQVKPERESNSTNDLADFLRNSGPPPGPTASKSEYSSGAPSPNIGSSRSGKFTDDVKSKAKFWNRKRHTDLP